jgi:hypothetical protein
MSSIPDDILDLLTAYALDALEPDEVVRVSELLRRQPELRQVVAELRAAADLLPHALDVEPPPELRQRTLDYALGKTSRQAPAPPQPNIWRRWTALLGGLSAALALTAALLWGQLSMARAELARVQQSQEQVAMVMAQSNALVTLEGDRASGAIVRHENGTVVLAASLPQLQPGRAYQLWYIHAGNPQPQPSDVFTVDPQGIALVTVSSTSDALAADTFAVTEEPAGGSQAPTTDPILVGSITTTTS